MKTKCAVCGESEIYKYCPWYGTEIQGKAVEYHPYGKCRDVVDRIRELERYLDDPVLGTSKIVIQTEMSSLLDKVNFAV